MIDDTLRYSLATPPTYRYSRRHRRTVTRDAIDLTGHFAAVASTSTLNSGRANPLTIISVEAGGPSGH